MVQSPVVGAALEEEADPKRGRNVYLVTLPRPKQATTAEGRALVAPGSMGKEEILEIFLSCCERPIYTDARSLSAQRPVPMKFVSVFRELHAESETGACDPHDHLPVQAMSQRQFMYLPIKKALLERHGLVSHWSSSHDGYWSPVRYCHMPSPKKKDSALDKNPVLWAAPPLTHPPLDECCNRPVTAAALQARRLKADRKAAEKGKAAPRITEMDVWPIVVRHGFKNTPDDMTAAQQLQAWAKQSASTPMCEFLFKHRSKLAALIDDIWEWELVEQSLAIARQPRMEALSAAATAPCLCHGLWVTHVMESFRLNGIDVPGLCRNILEALQHGRRESTPVIVLAGARGGEGKSLFLKALFSVYGDCHVFGSPEAGNFPFLNLLGKKLAFLDEWRFNAEIVSYATQCLWYDGSMVPITRPQNVPGATGHVEYRGTAPILATSKLSDIQKLQALAEDDPRTGVPKSAEASMIMRRLKVYPFEHRIPKPPPGIPFCGPCFARLLFKYSAPFAAVAGAAGVGQGVWV